MPGNAREEDTVTPANICHIEIIQDLPVPGAQIIFFKEQPWVWGHKRNKGSEVASAIVFNFILKQMFQ